MSELITVDDATSMALPVPDAAISVRLGTRADVAFIDALQKQYSKALGFFPRAQLEGYIDAGNLLVAEATKDEGGRMKDEREIASSSSFSPHPSSFLGYVAARDRYLKRDELGVVYQLCVSPSAQRGLVGATLLKELFARSAYGCKLYCCWCAQDLAANKFWEAMGFTAIAFRGGSAKKSRVHIFWQKRIRANDESTPWWFPAKTEGGAMREDRLVLPIPHGLRWDDAMPVMRSSSPLPLGEGEGVMSSQISQRSKSSCPHPNPLPKGEGVRTPRRATMQFGPPGAMPVVVEPAIVTTPETTALALPTVYTPAIRGKAKREKPKCDPKLIAAARELRDRWLEDLNAGPIGRSRGKYDVSRAIDERVTIGQIEPAKVISTPKKRLRAA